METYLVEWECTSCGRKHAFRYALSEESEWPSKFADLRCENEECGQVQDVPFRACIATPLGS